MARAGRACMDAGSCNLTRTTAVGRQKNQRHTLREKRERELIISNLLSSTIL